MSSTLASVRVKTLHASKPFPFYPSESLILTRLAARSPPLAGVAIPPNFDLGGIRLPPNVKQFISFAKRSLMRKRMYQDFVFSISRFIKNEMSSRIFGMDKIPLRYFSTSFAGAKTTISFRSLTILLVTTLKTSRTFIVSKFWMNFMTDGRLQPQDFDRHSIFATISSCFLSEVQ